MTFRRLFPNTNPAPTLEIARARLLSLYREWLREVKNGVASSNWPLDSTVHSKVSPGD